MECFIISGMSGAGKSFTTNVLEDMGYYCIDNMPTRLIPQFVELFRTNTTKYEKVAFVVDIRGDGDFVQLYSIMDQLKVGDTKVEMLFLDATNEVLVKRHKETRRKHPLEDRIHTLSRAVEIERDVLDMVKQQADFVVDTSSLSNAQLRAHIVNLFEGDRVGGTFVITVQSFGFKYGIPAEADLVLDVRFLKNPFYIPELKEHTGIEDDVANYVFSDKNAGLFLDKLNDMIRFLLPLYGNEGKTSLVVAIGCTGGHHRSVALSEKLVRDLSGDFQNISVIHRDISKG